MLILVAEDDPGVAASLRHALTRDGHRVLEAPDGAAALAQMQARPDLLVLDVLMPRMDGLEVCRRLRASRDRTPILMLTARDLVEDRVAGLDAGADDYLVKPFALDELRARVRALLRRHGGQDDVLELADLRMDTASATVTRGAREIALTRTEYALLELFLRRPGRVLAGDQVVELVWGYDGYTGRQTLWVHLSSLRGKLEAAGEPRLLHTVRGMGYVLREAR
ncbi:response regulator transcription factor [Cellulomonas alba]|uniref:Response regulator transcription factor n=1 Tax=Cellulomonas alba TaxID=3053467 RepID=A0ABT7SIH5_9CELL|nr:response regulator transcription factor [Cellulomonas alba]MDM7855985.1 response regulator transcription factor [Cellulomonas alba]